MNNDIKAQLDKIVDSCLVDAVERFLDMGCHINHMNGVEINETNYVKYLKPNPDGLVEIDSTKYDFDSSVFEDD